MKRLCIVAVGLSIGVGLGRSVAEAQPLTTASIANLEIKRQKHIQQGSDHFNKGEYLLAYEEFSAALALKPTAGVAAQMASCLAELGRYDEAIAQYEGVLRDYPDAAKTRAKVLEEVQKLKGKVGTIGVSGAAPEGALVMVDGRKQGKIRLAAPIRVAIGRHLVRVEKEGFPAMETTVVVYGGKHTDANMVPSVRKGRLVIREKHNWVLSVELDGKNVGVTPWEGLVDTGEHRVQLRGFMGVDALLACEAPTEAAEKGAKVQSAIGTTIVKLYDTTAITLGADEIDASLRIESTPRHAEVRIDDEQVGFSPWDGRVLLGEHVVELRADGFVTVKQTVRLERRKQRELQIVLERVPLPPGFWTGQRIGMLVGYGAGALGLGLFGVTGSLALSRKAILTESCPQYQCYANANAAIDEGKTLGNLATLGLVVGLTGVGGGTLALLAGKRLEAASVRVGLGYLGVEGRF